MAGEVNGNRSGKLTVAGTAPRHLGSSNEDLSEYTDADESISAPTEFLAEFLSSLMQKDYPTALKYCKLILQYEPNNATAKEFYPLIIEKLEKLSLLEEDPSSSGEDPEPKSSHSESDVDDDGNSEDDVTSESEKEDDNASLEHSYEGNMTGLDNLADTDNLAVSDKSALLDNRSSKSLSPRTDSDGTTNSYSSLEDEEVTRDDNILEEVIVEDHFVDDNNGNAVSYKQRRSGNAPDVDNCNFNWFTKMSIKKRTTSPTTGTSFQTSSDSESPTDPVTQQTIQMLRAKFVHATN